MASLSAVDVRKFIQEPSPKVRSMLVAKIAMDFRDEAYSEREAAVAGEIFRLLLRDVERLVRRTLSEHLCMCDRVPRDIALALARDEAEVAVPMLECSPVLTDDDLVELVRSAEETLRLYAVAKREKISGKVCEALLESRNEKAAAILFGNKGAELSERVLAASWDFVTEHGSLLAALVHRGGLPASVAQKLFGAVSDELKRKLTAQYALHGKVLEEALTHASERSMFDVLSPASERRILAEDEMGRLIQQLYESGKLTHSFLLRALWAGDLAVFEAGLAKLARVPLSNAMILLYDQGDRGFLALYRKASMPEQFAEATRVLLRMAKEESESEMPPPQAFGARLRERIVAGGLAARIDGMQYLLKIHGD